jgi:hypothetical protein
MKTWAESKQIPGQFTGSTGVRLLTPAELSSGYQAWARKVKLLLRVLFHFLKSFLRLIILKKSWMCNAFSNQMLFL